MAKRKRSLAAGISTATDPTSTTPIPLPSKGIPPQPPATLSRRSSRRTAASVNPDKNSEVIDAPGALRASPDGEVHVSIAPKVVKKEKTIESDLSDAPDIVEEPLPKKQKKAKAAPVKKEDVKPVASKSKAQAKDNSAAPPDPDDDNVEEADEEELVEALSRPPPVHSDYLPLPWKGRLGYACLNTYLRYSNPPVFCSRTCRIASILEHRHPLKDPSQPEHATKNRPDKEQPATIGRGQKFVEELGLANARDIVKMIRWNDKYGIKFMRLSSEMFPFASHEEYGYRLAPFASEVLAEAGKVIAELGHRVTCHPGQFTQLGSPRKVVVENAVRDLEFHDELLSLLKLPEQMNKDAVLILHMGGTFGDKAATLDRFRENYATLSQSIKNRVVLENDDVSWSVHDLLPICQELNIPLCLDFHHHNIIFDETQTREGTKDIIDLFPAITETWKRKGIRQKMHYSEPTPKAITKTQRRKHSPRVMTLPPCPADMDLMIEAKDKEQAVFELMRTFKLPGWETFNDIIPYVRKDDNKPVRTPAKKKTPKKSKKTKGEEEQEEEDPEENNEAEPAGPIPDKEVGMGGPEGRVYWPPTMEEWLRPKKREIKKKVDEDGNAIPAKPTPAQKKKAAAVAVAAAADQIKSEEGDANESTAHATSAKARKTSGSAVGKGEKTTAAPARKARRNAKAVLTPSASDGEEQDDADVPDDLSAEEETPAPKAPTLGRRKSGRAGKINYAEE